MPKDLRNEMIMLFPSEGEAPSIKTDLPFLTWMNVASPWPISRKNTFNNCPVLFSGEKWSST